MRVAIQGERGAFSEEAALVGYGEDIEIVPCRTLEDVFRCLSDKGCDAAAIPVENSYAGTVVGAYELLLMHPFPVLGEFDLPVHHCLLALPGEDLSSIERVLSHPQALAQCRGFLGRLSVELQAWYDTAGSARHLAEVHPPRTAAIASRHAASLYGLAVLAGDIEDAKDNVTRFYYLGEVPDRVPKLRGHGRTVFAFGIPDEPGALLRALEPFARAGINLSKLESRPNRQRPFEYVFYAAVAAHAEDPPCRQALEELSSVATDLRLLGSYWV